MDTILIFAGGTPPSSAVVSDLPGADLTIAADSGYDIAHSLGFGVDVLVGDLDSIVASSLPNHVLVEKHPTDKDETDLELAIELANRESPGRIVIVAGAGGRQDHEIATANLICADRWSGIEEIDWISHRSRCHVVRGMRVVHSDIGDLISLIPMHGRASGVTTRGFKWDLTDEVLEAGSTLGVSNEFLRPAGEIRVSSGCVLAVIPT